jgi:tetratricopeptide (TPR) repeat protein
MLYQLQQRRDDAKASYMKVLALSPRAAIASNNLAWMTLEDGDLSRALQLAQIAKAELPDRPEINDTLGWIYVKRGLPAMAVPVLTDAVAERPNHAPYHYHLGMAYLGTKDYGPARAALNKALALNPSFSGAEDAKRALAELR